MWFVNQRFCILRIYRTTLSEPYRQGGCIPGQGDTLHSKSMHRRRNCAVNRVILWLNGTLCRELVPYGFPLVVLHTISIISFHCGACLEVVFEFEWRATYFASLRAKLILAPLGIPKWVRPSMNWYGMFFVQTPTPSPSMHWKCTQHGTCMQNNQHPTKGQSNVSHH